MNKQPNTPHLSTIKETAKALRISDRSLNALVSGDRVPSVKIGRSRRFDIAEVIAVLKS
ncbi:helix-turn-helix domain-containing protein [Verrucomicrobiales bacterium]|jgi:excisionase family DNA binding protein|nr:helix-turn-helix domain-containing protein [bacterium]MDB4657156.1 helix-turn-helix domain-containing protein [Verrucomicrobiales bacterium]MDB4662271.1 helix-turn-helix domain-containing protein [Verrucomicrobiales bacterium]